MADFPSMRLAEHITIYTRTHIHRSCTHEQINQPLFAQILTELLHTDRKFEQIKSIYLLHEYGAIRILSSLCDQFWRCAIGEMYGAAPLCNLSVWEPRFGGFTWKWEA